MITYERSVFWIATLNFMGSVCVMVHINYKKINA